VRRDGPMPVASFAASSLGFHDLYGNVWEMTADCWRESYHPALASGEAYKVPACSNFVIRGGGFQSTASQISPSVRRLYMGEIRYPWLGFRIARSE
jgi:formylglycine-generating enzyme required for sulfatase activity